MSLQSERQKIAHLLRRFGFGASEGELNYYSSEGLSGAIKKLLDFENVEEPFNFGIEAFAQGKNAAIKPASVQFYWLTRMLCTRRPLLEKMTLFWHDHFATSAQKVTGAKMMLDQNEVLRRNALGSFRDLLHAVSKDGAMIFWLDNEFNIKGKPNENFAREVMELFTLGVGNYTEKDVQEGARAFTGWSLSNSQNRNKSRGHFVYLDGQHDSGMKSFLGNSGPFDGEDVLNILCDQPQCARFIARKLWEWFAYPNPDSALVERLSAKFKSSGMNIKALLQEIMESPEFYSEKSNRAIYKNPIDFALAPLRQLGVGEMTAKNLVPDKDGLINRRSLLAVVALHQTTKSMGMDVLYPPDVSGWDGGASWISSATMVERIRWGDRLFGQASSNVKNSSFKMGYDIAGLFDKISTPEQAVQLLVSVFDAPMPTAKIRSLNDAARSVSGSKVTAENAAQTAAVIARLIFASPEFQFA